MERVHYTTIFRSKVKSLPHLISRLLKQRNPNIRTATEKSRNFLKATESFTLLHCVLVALRSQHSGIHGGTRLLPVSTLHLFIYGYKVGTCGTWYVFLFFRLTAVVTHCFKSVFYFILLVYFLFSLRQVHALQ